MQCRIPGNVFDGGTAWAVSRDSTYSTGTLFAAWYAGRTMAFSSFCPNFPLNIDFPSSVQFLHCVRVEMRTCRSAPWTRALFTPGEALIRRLVLAFTIGCAALWHGAAPAEAMAPRPLSFRAATAPRRANQRAWQCRRGLFETKTKAPRSRARGETAEAVTSLALEPGASDAVGPC